VDQSPESNGRDELAWHGRRVRLRAFEAADWAAYANWDDDAEQARSLDAVPFPRSDEHTQHWAEELASRPRDGDNVRFVIEDERGEVVGDLTTHHCNPRVGTFSYGISIRRDRRGLGYATEAIGLVLRHYFDELRYQKVTIGVYAFNEASIRLHEKLGFRQEGRLRRMTYTRGRFFDELVFGLTVEEFGERDLVQRQVSGDVARG
jgi:RimJ/RimL family protein N-acetyltransferase